MKTFCSCHEYLYAHCRCGICKMVFHESCALNINKITNVCPQKLATRYAFLLKEGQLHYGNAQTVLQLEGVTMRLEPRYFLQFPDLLRYVKFEKVAHIWATKSYKGMFVGPIANKVVLDDGV